MSEILEQLSNDHRNVALMMKLLDQQLDKVHDMENADFELMHDVMLYMTHYPDRHHHPMEEHMFDRMGDAEAPVAEAITALRREHTALLEKGAAFRDELRLVVDGSMVEREAIEAMGRDYVAFMRHHMTREDEDVFPAAERMLGDDDWAAVRAALDNLEDPVFGPIVDEQYHTLLDHIRQHG